MATKKKQSSPGGMGRIGSLKGRCASALVRFWSELDVPEGDTIGKYVIVTLRILKYEGLSSDDAVAWVGDRRYRERLRQLNMRFSRAA
jgi:hypothetical protein